MQRPSRKIVLVGFTLIEIMIGLALTSIIAASSARTFSTVYSSMKSSEKTIEIYDELKMVSEYLGSKFQTVGGGVARPWDSLWLIDGGGTASDQLYVFANSSKFSADCTVDSKTGVTLKFPTSGCCLDNDNDGNLDDGIVGSMVLVTSVDSSIALKITNAVVSAGTCQATFNNGSQPMGNNLNTFANPNAMAIGYFNRYYRDATTNVLKEQNMKTGSVESIADHVFDFQVSLGYDFNPAEGVISDDNSATDEWAYNSSADAFNGDGLLLNGSDVAERLSMRMIGIGLVIGARVSGRTGTSLLMNRTTPVVATNTVFVDAISRVMMRNINVFY